VKPEYRWRPDDRFQVFLECICSNLVSYLYTVAHRSMEVKVTLKRKKDHKYLIHVARYGSLNINYCALIIDFSKAFDSVDHVVPLSKLVQLNLPSFVVKWICSFLAGTGQQCKVNGNLSVVASISCSVVQGVTTAFLPGSDLFVGERSCRCWRHTAMRLMECRRPV